MPNPLIPGPEFPNVAQLPGVPQLARASAVVGNISLAVGAVQSFLGLAAQQKPAWGVFLARKGTGVLTRSNIGDPVITPDNFTEFGVHASWKLSTFPIQDGAFSSYNKVVIPRTVSLKMTKGGTVQQRTQLLAQIAGIAKDTNFYNILVPEGVYLDFNVESTVLRRVGQTGAYYFADLEIIFQNIRSVTGQYSTTTANTTNAQNPVATPPQNLGTQSPQTAVPTSVAQAAATAIANTPH